MKNRDIIIGGCGFFGLLFMLLAQCGALTAPPVYPSTTETMCR